MCLMIPLIPNKQNDSRRYGDITRNKIPPIKWALNRCKSLNEQDEDI